MTPGQWEQVKALFERLEEASAEERGRELAAFPDPAVAAEAARLLDLHAADCPVVEALRPPAEWVQEAVELRAFRAGDLAAGRFRIVKFLAAGGMGEVYEAQDTELNERVAVKTLRPELALTPSAYARFKQEIQLSRRVTHPNVCRIHDLWQHVRDGRTIHFLTMELLEGETLAARLSRDGRMAPEVVLAVLRQMVEGLEAAHAAGVVHRDLKPGNVMLVGERVVITDFGLSRSLSEAGATVSGSTLGTPAYMAPEQIEGGQTGPETDIYSFGVVIYEMLTGVLPFRGGSPMAMAVKKLRETPVPPSALAPGIGARWDRAVLSCLAQDPSLRFRSARALLEAVEGQREVRLPRARPRRTAWWVRAAAGGAVLLLAVLLYWRFRPDYRPNPEAARWYAAGVSALHEEAFFKAKQLLEKSVEADGRYAPRAGAAGAGPGRVGPGRPGRRGVVAFRRSARARRSAHRRGSQVRAARFRGGSRAVPAVGIRTRFGARYGTCAGAQPRCCRGHAALPGDHRRRAGERRRLAATGHVATQPTADGQGVGVVRQC
jgi:hypothetical protein